jgi:hypothetical protein
VKNEVLQTAKEVKYILHRIERRKAKLISHILRRNCILKHVIEGNREGKLEVIGRRVRRHIQPLNDLKEETEYWNLKA